MGRKKLDNAVLFMRVPSEMLPRLRKVVKDEIKRLTPIKIDTNHSSQNRQNETI